MRDALYYLLDNIFIRFGSKLYRQVVGVPKGTSCSPLVAVLTLFCYERDFILEGQPNHGWQFCFHPKLHAGGSDFILYEGSDLTYFLIRW